MIEGSTSIDDIRTDDVCIKNACIYTCNDNYDQQCISRIQSIFFFFLLMVESVEANGILLCIGRVETSFIE